MSTTCKICFCRIKGVSSSVNKEDLSCSSCKRIICYECMIYTLNGVEYDLCIECFKQQ